MRQDIQRRAKGKVGIGGSAADATGARSTQHQPDSQQPQTQRANLYDEVTARTSGNSRRGAFLGFSLGGVLSALIVAGMGVGWRVPGFAPACRAMR